MMNISELKDNLGQKIRNADLSIEEIQSLEKTINAFLSKSNQQKKTKERPFGVLKGAVLYISDDFDETLDEFKDYM